jgi:membrane-associated phospholipid phosphatase
MNPSINRWKLFAIFLFVGLIATVLIMLALAELHEEIIEPSSIQIDHAIQAMVHAHTSPGLTKLMFALTWIGSPITLIPVIPLVAGLLWWKRWRDEAVVLLIAMVGAGAMSAALKLHFRRVRPDLPWALVHEHSFSFPSGHSVFAVVLYGILAYLGMRHLHGAGQRVAMLATAVLLILGIGLSRIYLGVHFPSDVAAGYFVGLVWLAVVAGCDWKLRRSEQVQPAA